jgi:hypothetical protein
MHGVNGAKAPRGAFPPRAKATGIPSYRKFYLSFPPGKKLRLGLGETNEKNEKSEIFSHDCPKYGILLVDAFR